MARVSPDSGLGVLTESESLGGDSLSAVNVEDLSSDEDSQPALDARELQTILEGLNQYSGWRVFPDMLAKLMSAAVKALQRGSECVSQATFKPCLDPCLASLTPFEAADSVQWPHLLTADSERFKVGLANRPADCRTSQQRVLLQKLIHEAIPQTFERCLEDPTVRRWQHSTQLYILNACMSLASLAVQQLEVSLHLICYVHSNRLSPRTQRHAQCRQTLSDTRTLCNTPSSPRQWWCLR